MSTRKKAGYVDGFVIPIPKKHLKAYRLYVVKQFGHVDTLS
jgi:uncharacterized protein YbaA (DUF1428 family)